ncbi:hypothetical protein B0H66DRAFT_377765 [Apodospora peruviana]|uniref:Hemerythrin-like domain-containing protein n=1 Tax=Apodospora peruviana TaxID=516989 RepID=A0AAE0HTJ7_9PEZI|nr:hypothetical protein B0H66DRAFT_377765 [Apodospora peruviana]
MPKISQVVKQDHDRLKDAYHHLWAVNPEDRDANKFIWELDRYLIVEDMLVTPALEDHLGKTGKERSRRLSDDYESMNAKLRHMQSFEPTEASFDSALRAVWVDLEPHIREEASGDLDHLEEHMSESDSEALGKKYEDIKALLQQPYGVDGTPDERTLKALLEMPRQELMVKVGVTR